ncbi:MAG: PAS domain S-box protein [Verrucomicrobia bacterium]|nr:PAS domain S-box protein [Verrucomicrobiota bacterium]MCH8526131.1 PAS domain S-box protein [Kiritimatiellia bacterium]
MITQFLLNVAILVSISVISALVLECYAKKRFLHDLIQGLLFGLTAIFAMMHPVSVEEGFIFDARTVVLSLGGWFFGPLTACLSALLAVFYRWNLGGIGAVPGIFTVVAASAAGLLVHFRRPLSKGLPKSANLLLFGFCVHVLVVVILWMNLPKVYVAQVAPTFLLIYPLATMLSGKVLVNQYRLRDSLNTLHIQNEQIRLITDSMREVLWILELPSQRFSYISPSNEHHTGYTPEEAMTRSLAETLSPESYQNVTKWLENDLHILTDPNASDSFKTRLVQERCKDGSFIWSEISLSVQCDAKGAPLRIIGVSRNVTKRLQQEADLQESEQRFRVLSEDLQQSLAEKNTLIKEVHHRVKNNLQIITSLLRLEAARLTDPETREVVLDMQRRVRSMSLLHETVYQSDSLTSINMNVYFNKLSRQILNTMSDRHTRVQPNLEIAPVELNIEQAIPCGLLLNELLSNACKHAFSPDKPGQIQVRLSSKDKATLVLEVIDNGKGLPPDFQQRRKTSLGLQLIDDFSRQLNGTLDIQTNQGAAFRITFPIVPASGN